MYITEQPLSWKNIEILDNILGNKKYKPGDELPGYENAYIYSKHNKKGILKVMAFRGDNYYIETWKLYGYTRKVTYDSELFFLRKTDPYWDMNLDNYVSIFSE